MVFCLAVNKTVHRHGDGTFFEEQKAVHVFPANFFFLFSDFSELING